MRLLMLALVFVAALIADRPAHAGAEAPTAEAAVRPVVPRYSRLRLRPRLVAYGQTQAQTPVELRPQVVEPRVRPTVQPTPLTVYPYPQDQVPPPPPPPPVTSQPRALMMAPPPQEADIWPDGYVPMCFLNPDPADAQQRFYVRAAAQTWQQAAKVRFDIAEDCATDTYQQRVPITIVHDPLMFASADHLGVSLLDGGGVTLNAEYLFNNPLCGRNGVPGGDRCFYADALHELGHVLGFSHDHVSPRAPNCLARQQTPEAVDQDETYYDKDSIMNYCNDRRWWGVLSTADLCSVQSAYGPLVGDRPTRSQCYAITGAVPAH